MNYITGFSNREFTILEVVGQGNRLVKHWNFKGTHTGDFFGMPASGNKLNLSGTTMVTMKDGKIAKEQDFFDVMSMVNQLTAGDVNADATQGGNKPPDAPKKKTMEEALKNTKEIPGLVNFKSNNKDLFSSKS